MHTYYLLVAIVAAMLNVILSLVVPPLLKDNTTPFLMQVKQSYDCNKDIIMVSTLMTAIFVFVSLEITPWVNTNVFKNLAKLTSTLPK